MRCIAVILAACLLLVSGQSADDDSVSALLAQIFNEGQQNKTDSGSASKDIDLTPTNTGKTQDCVNKDGLNGKCVLYYQCDPKTRTLITDGASLIDFRGITCSHYLEICCLEDEIYDTPQSLPQSSSQSSVHYQVVEEKKQVVMTTDDPEDDLDLTPTRHNNEGPPIYSTPRPPKPTSPIYNRPSEPASPLQECGWSNPGAYIFSVRSNTQAKKSKYANYAEFPWMVALLKRSDDDTWLQDDYLGGGSLIHPSVVLTIAHMFPARMRRKEIPADQVKCRAGEWDTQTTLELYPFQERNVARYVIHPNYYDISLYNDVSLVFLEQPFLVDPQLTPHIALACLASEPFNSNEECYSMGWGKIAKKKYANVLKKIPLKIVDADNCTTRLRNTRLGEYFQLHDSLTCAGGEAGRDACTGDGGSPLVCPIGSDGENYRFAVHGLVSYGINNCGSGNPGVYAKVTAVRSWIDEQMKAEGFGTATYTY